jgi:presenilin-like A22 family membrane protease
MKVIENVAVAACIVASVIVSLYAKDSNFVLVFSLFAASALVLAATSYKKQDWAIMRLQIFFVAANSYALAKELI